MQLIDHLGIRDGHRNLTFLGGDWGFLGGASVLKDRPGGKVKCILFVMFLISVIWR